LFVTVSVLFCINLISMSTETFQIDTFFQTSSQKSTFTSLLLRTW